MKKRVAYYGGSFDPPHRGHISVAHALLEQFGLDNFVFVPAFHAPHKTRKRPTSAYDRYAMLCLVTQNEPAMTVSRIEIESPERPYSVETLGRLTAERPNEDIFFVMGADSWEEITTWREWETVLGLTNHIVVTRPGYEIGFDHVTDAIRDGIVDLRYDRTFKPDSGRSIFVSDAVRVDVSATEIRHKIVNGDASWRNDVPDKVAKYVEKYQIYT